MSVHVEEVADDLILYMRQHFRDQLAAVVSETDARIPVGMPTAYYLGEYSRHTVYKLPVVFVVIATSEEGGKGNVSQWTHSCQVVFIMEGVEEQQLTRGAYRVGAAMWNTLHDRDITRAGVTARTATAKCRRLTYGPLLGKDRIFSKEIFLSITLSHTDLLTPIG